MIILQEIVLISVFVFALIWKFADKLNGAFMALATTAVDEDFDFGGPLLMLPSSAKGKAKPFPPELLGFLKEDYTLAEEASCEALQDPKVLFHLKQSASKINASVLMLLRNCKIDNFDDFLDEFTHWADLKQNDMLFYYMLLVDLDFENLSSDSLLSLPKVDLIANWPTGIDQGHFCAKITSLQSVEDLIYELKLVEVKGIFKVIQWPCVRSLLQTAREPLLQFLFKWLPEHAQSDPSCLIQWQLLMESLLLDQLLKININLPYAELQYRRAHEIIKTGMQGKVVQPIDSNLRAAMIDIYAERTEKCALAQIISLKPPRDKLADPDNPPIEEDYLSFQLKQVFSAEVVFGNQVLHYTDFPVPHLPFYRLELARSLFDVDLAVWLLHEQPVISELTIMEWIKKTLHFTEGTRIIKALARDHKEALLNVVKESSFSDEEIQLLLERFSDLPNMLSIVLGRCNSHNETEVELPFLPSNARLVSLTGSEIICLKAGTVEALPKLQKRALGKQFASLLKSAQEKDKHNKEISDFMLEAFQAISINLSKHLHRIEITFLGHLGDDQGGLTRHFLEIVFGVLGDEEFGCLMGANSDCSNLMTFTPFLCPAWAGVLGILHAQALVTNAACPFVLSFDAQELEGLEDLPIDCLPKLHLLLNGKGHCPPSSVFKLGRKFGDCIAKEEVSERYFKALRSIAVALREEATDMYWRCLIQTLGVSDSVKARESIQNVLSFSVPRAPTGAELMEIIRFTKNDFLLADNIPFEEAFESIILELSSEHIGFTSMFLRYVRGSSQAPTTGYDSLSIAVEAKEEKGTVLPLPTASTCMQTLKWSITEGATMADLKAKLLYAVEYGEGYSFV